MISSIDLGLFLLVPLSWASAAPDTTTASTSRPARTNSRYIPYPPLRWIAPAGPPGRGCSLSRTSSLLLAVDAVAGAAVAADRFQRVAGGRGVLVLDGPGQGLDVGAVLL